MTTISQQSEVTKSNYPRLIADIGGTNARFAIESNPFQLENIIVLPCKDYATFFDAITDYIKQINIEIPKHIGIAIANPVTGDEIRMTNHHWQFSISAMQEKLGVETFLVINDFRAQALAVTQMNEENLHLLNGLDKYQPMPKDKAVAVIGPGTGLGVSGLIPDGRGKMIALSSEGGHVAFSPRNELESQLLAYAEKVFNGHVSAERFLQGDGLLLIYRFMSELNGYANNKNTPAEITNGALLENDLLCKEVLSLYCNILGSFCANVILTIGGVGGVYLTGGILPRFIDFLKQSSFRQNFEDKGRFTGYMHNIPVYVVTHSNPGLLGSAVALNDFLG